MRVRLPDGTVIDNVPDGTSQKDLLDTLAQNGYDVGPIQRRFMFQVGDIQGAAKKAGEELSLGQKIGAGLGSAAQKMAAGLGQLHQYSPIGMLTNNWLGKQVAPSQEALDVAKATVQGAGPVAQGADIAGGVALTAAIPARVFGLAPTRGKAILDTALTSGLITGATTPGDLATRAKEAGISAGMSAIAPAVLGIGQAGRRISTKEGRQLAKAEQLRQEIGEQASEDLVSKLRAPYANAALGVAPTAAMKTQNPTLEALELGSRVKRPDLYSALDEANAVRRWDALQGIAKDQGALRAAEGTRERITSGLREEALGLAGQRQGFEAPVGRAVADLMTGPSRSNPGMQKMANYVLGELEQGVTPQQLYTIRKTLTDAVPMGTELGASIKMARAERMKLVGAIDDALDQASGGAWRLYLKSYGGFSQPITSMKAGQAISDVFQHTPNRTSMATGGVPVMTPAALSRATENFGERQFGGQTISRITPEERGLLGSIVNDLQRQQAVMKARGVVGSDTAAKIAAADRGDAVAAGLLGQAVDRATGLPVGGLLAGQASRGLQKKKEEALAAILQDPAALAKALEDAARAQRMMAAASGVSRFTRGPSGN